MAEVEGDMEKAEDLRLELEDLEDRAKELDNIRTSTISAIRSVCRDLYASLSSCSLTSYSSERYFHLG